jgi:hypothetical protein
MAEPYAEWQDYGLRVVLDPNDAWREIVYGGHAHVTVMRGCPDLNEIEDRVVAVDIQWPARPVTHRAIVNALLRRRLANRKRLRDDEAEWFADDIMALLGEPE